MLSRSTHGIEGDGNHHIIGRRRQWTAMCIARLQGTVGHLCVHAFTAIPRTQAQQLAFSQPLAFVVETTIAARATIMFDQSIRLLLAFLLQPQPGFNSVAVGARPFTAEFHRAVGDRPRRAGTTWRCCDLATGKQNRHQQEKAENPSHAGIVAQSCGLHTNERRLMGAVVLKSRA